MKETFIPASGNQNPQYNKMLNWLTVNLIKYLLSFFMPDYLLLFGQNNERFWVFFACL